MQATLVYYLDMATNKVEIDGIYYDAEAAMNRGTLLMKQNPSFDVHIQTYLIRIPDVFAVEEYRGGRDFVLQGFFETEELADSFVDSLESNPHHSDDHANYLITQWPVVQETDFMNSPDPLPDSLGPYIRTNIKQGKG